MHCPEYVWEMKDLTVNSKIDIFQEKYTDSQNAQNMTRIFKIASTTVVHIKKLLHLKCLSIFYQL
jgi:hypothetical protein